MSRYVSFARKVFRPNYSDGVFRVAGQVHTVKFSSVQFSRKFSANNHNHGKDALLNMSEGLILGTADLIKAKIVTAEDDLAQAIKDKDRDMILMCGNNLAELRREENNLEAGAGKSISPFCFLTIKCFLPISLMISFCDFILCDQILIV